MSAFQIFTLPSQQALDASARALPGAKLYFYLTGTSTPTDAYSDSALTTPIANPLTADSGGVFAQFFLDPDVTYRIVLKSAAGVTLQTWDPANESPISLTALTDLLDATPTSLAIYPRTAAEISAGVTPVNYAYPPGDVRRYGAAGDGVADDTTALNNALAVANQSVGEVHMPAGVYLVGKIEWPGNNITLRGAGSAMTYTNAAAPKTILRAKTGTTIVLDLVQTGTAVDREGNRICDLGVDGNGIAAVGIDCNLNNVIERVTVQGCTSAGIRLPDFVNSTRIVRCGLSFNSGWGLFVGGVGSTTYSVVDSIISHNTLGGINLEAGVLASFKRCVIESNSGPGLRIYNPDLKGFYGIEFDTCWFEDNGSMAPNYTLVISAGTSDMAHSPSRITFRNCRINTSVNTRKWLFADVVAWLRFERCNFTPSTASDAITLAPNARFVAFIESATSTTAVNGISATQMDNAIAQGSHCYSHDIEIKRAVGSGAPAAAFTNSWVNFGGNATDAAYYFNSDGDVCLEGSIKSGTIPSSAFTLPVGYRPAFTRYFAVSANGAFGTLVVNTDGTVVPTVGSNTHFSLDGVCFKATPN